MATMASDPLEFQSAPIYDGKIPFYDGKPILDFEPVREVPLPDGRPSSTTSLRASLGHISFIGIQEYS